MVEIQMNDTMIREYIVPSKFDEVYGNVWLQKIKAAMENKDSSIQIDYVSGDYFVGIDESPRFNILLDKNGRFLKDQFPMYTITLNYYKKRAFALAENKKFTTTAFNKKYEYDNQEALSFIRIENEYQLIEVVQRK